MTDLELLEFSAKAAAYKVKGPADKFIVQPGHFSGGFVIANERGGDSPWNPLTDDGDALRLAVQLHINIRYSWDGVDDQYDAVWAEKGRVVCDEELGMTPSGKQFDSHEATRRAIVRAAAEIGKGMQ